MKAFVVMTHWHIILPVKSQMNAKKIKRVQICQSKRREEWLVSEGKSKIGKKLHVIAQDLVS